MLVEGSGGGKYVLWEEKIVRLEEGRCYLLKEGRCYLLKNVIIREYGHKYLSMAKEGSDIADIEDIGETVDSKEVRSASG